MSIKDEILRIKNNIANAYSICSDKGANIPQNQNSSNLANCISSISVGSGSSNVDLKPLIKKAWGWTNRNAGKSYFVNWNKDGSYSLMGGSFKTLVKNFATNYMGSYTSYILDGYFYSRNTSTNSYIKYDCEITDWIGYSTTGSSGLAIRENGSLYYYSLSTNGKITLTLIDDSGVWSKLASLYSSPGTYGIRNGALCLINISSKTYTVIDDTGTWTDICGLSYGVSGFGIKDGQLYYIAIKDGARTLISSEKGFTAVSGSSSGLAICNGSLYYISGTSTAKLLDNTQTWIKICGSQNAITSTGKLYYSSYGSSIQQVGTDTGWTDICGQSAGVAIGLNKGNVYWSLANNSLKQITFDGDITQIDGAISTMTEIARTCAVFVSNNPKNKNIFTPAYPYNESKIYFDSDMNGNFNFPISSVDSNFEYIETLPTIDGSKPKFYRNAEIDTYFSKTPPENIKTEYLINILEGS